MTKCESCGLVQKPGLHCARCNAVLPRPDLALSGNPAITNPGNQPSTAPPAMQREIPIDRRTANREGPPIPAAPPRRLPIPNQAVAQPSSAPSPAAALRPPVQQPAPRPQPAPVGARPPAPQPQPQPAPVAARPPAPAPAPLPRPPSASVRAAAAPVSSPQPTPQPPPVARPPSAAAVAVPAPAPMPIAEPAPRVAAPEPIAAPLPAPTPAPVEAAVAAAPMDVEVIRASPASIFKRVGAWIIDAALISLVLFAYLKVAQALMRHPPIPTNTTGLDWLVNRVDAYQGIIKYGAVLGGVVGFVYSALFHALGGRTPGERVFGIRLVDRTGRAPSLGRSVIRSLLALVSFGLLLLGFWMAFFDRRRQALHDKLTATFVIKPLPNS